MASDKDESNPYKPPRDDEGAANPFKRARTDDSTENDIAAIRIAFEKTRPWITFFMVMTYIGAGLLAIAGITIFAFTSSSRATGPLGNMGPAVVILYVGLAVVYILIGQRLGRYSASIRAVSNSDGRLDAIADAVQKQQQIWSFFGYLTVTIIGLYIVGIVAFTALAR